MGGSMWCGVVWCGVGTRGVVCCAVVWCRARGVGKRIMSYFEVREHTGCRLVSVDVRKLEESGGTLGTSLFMAAADRDGQTRADMCRMGRPLRRDGRTGGKGGGGGGAGVVVAG